MSSTETYTLPTENHASSSTSNGASSATKLWHSLTPSKKASKKRRNSPDPLDEGHPDDDTSSMLKEEKWWHVHWGRGMANDLKRRLPWYLSDWRDAWDYRVVPATVYMYFANILPALAFSLDMFEKTNNSYGVNEVLLASVLGAVVFAFFAAQPLVIVGVTGPITVFSYTVYDIVEPKGINFFSFMCLVGLWSLAMHWFLAISNSCNGLTYVTRFSCDTFGFLVAFIYLQKGIQVLTRQYSIGDASAYLSIMVSLLVLMVAYACGIVGGSTLFHRMLRKFVEDYGTPLTIIFFTGFVHIGKMEGITISKLPTSKAFFPTKDRSWFVNPAHEMNVSDVFIAMPFAILLTILFWFDHNVSSLIAQGTEFPLRKPAGFHWDIFLLGLTTGVAGILGIPFPNGLIPQAPFHTNALCVTRQVVHPASEKPLGDNGDSAPASNAPIRVVDHVVEQRVSNLAQGLLTLGTMTGPLLIVLHLIPQAVLAGLFFVMGVQALEGNGITLKLLYLLRDNTLYPSPATDDNAALRALPRQHMIWLFVALELAAFGAAFAITQTIAAIGFPVIILALIPARAFLLPRWFDAAELRALDAPTASPFTMESVGGVHGALLDDDAEDAEGDDTVPDLAAAEEGRRSGSAVVDDDDPVDLATAHQSQMQKQKARRRTSSRRARPGAEIWGQQRSGSYGVSPVSTRVRYDVSPEARRSGGSGGGAVELQRMQSAESGVGSRTRSRSKVGRLGDREF